MNIPNTKRKNILEFRPVVNRNIVFFYVPRLYAHTRLIHSVSGDSAGVWKNIFVN